MATILVVDDRETARRYLATVLENGGHRVVEAQDGFEALARLSSNPPDLVITDILMPAMDGFEFIRQMRARPESRNTPVIVYTAAYDENATRTLAADCTAATILAKPSEPAFLIRRVGTVLGEPAGESRSLGDEFRSAHLELVTIQLHRRMTDLERSNAELLEINKALEESNDALRQFAYAAAHDLQEPLRNVVNAGEMLSRPGTQGIDKESAEYLLECTGGARRMHDMIKDLLAYTTVVEDCEVTKTLADSNEVMREVMTNLAAAIDESGAQVQSGHLPALWVERTHLSQLLQNLVGNALKYRRKSVATVVQISAVRDRDLWVFQVRDNGIGFNPDYGDRIFKVFKRLHGRGEYPGTGIGLAICARIVAHYRGQIWAEGRPGEGAVFSFTLPAAFRTTEAT